MKKTIITIMAVAAVLTGCKKEHIANEGGTGTLSLSVTGNSQEFTDVNVKAGEGEPTIDVNTFKVKITSKDGSYSREWEAFSEMESMLELSAGEYTVTATSPQGAESKWGEPVYSGSKDFAVAIGSVSNVELVCSISNMKISLRPTERFMSELSDVEVTVFSDVSNSITWTKADIEASNSGFLSVAPFEVQVKGYRALSGKTATYTIKIADAAAGNHYILNLDAITTGELGDFQITIDDSLVDNNVDIDIPGFEEIPVPGGDDPEEPSDPAPEDPAITMEWVGNNDFATMPISNDMSVVINISAPAGIKTFVVAIESDVLNNNLGLTELDLINPGDMASIAELILKGQTLLNATSVTLDLSSLVPLIAGFSPEDGSLHTFKLSMSDNDGNTLEKSAVFSYNAE